MGAGASHVIFDYQYQNERKLLRQDLMLQFEIDPKNQNLLVKIKTVRALITQHPHICATAAREAQHDEDAAPTTQQAAFNELDRLLTIYETSTILKSVQCRIGPVACPLGHFAAYYDNFDILKEGKKKPTCNICEKVVQDGYHCSYCMYNLCVMCSGVYCSYGHTMRLWTHPESAHTCFICSKDPIHSGYRCIQCDIDFCDYCTWKEGRKHITNIILDRMAKDLKYIEDHVEESETAMRTIKDHRKKVAGAEDAYPTIKHLYDFSQSLSEIQKICMEEVKQTRITKAILRYRAILSIGKEYSKTARDESLKTENYTQEEKERLESLLAEHERLRSVAYRCQCIVSCPLGHGLQPFEGVPETYTERVRQKKEKAQRKASTKSQQLVPGTSSLSLSSSSSLKGGGGTHRPDILCKICQRNASPGYHCSYCEYDLCNSCASIFCAEGHPMTMWTEPSSLEKCFLCSKEPILMGYRCNRCSVDLCDICTTKEGRNRLRCNWETEMNQLLQFMNLNKRFSDIALFYEWRHANQIVSIGLLVDYVKELRMAKKSALKQIEQKPIIDKIKVLRSEIVKFPDLNATAARELNRSDIFVFKDPGCAIDEMKRLADILKSYIYSQSQENRAECGVACPLAHGMIPITIEDDDETLEGDFDPLFPPSSKAISDSQRKPDENDSNKTPEMLENDKKAKMRALVTKLAQEEDEGKYDNDEEYPESVEKELRAMAASASQDRRKNKPKEDPSSSSPSWNLSERQLSVHNNPSFKTHPHTPVKDMLLAVSSSNKQSSPPPPFLSSPSKSVVTSLVSRRKPKRFCRICASPDLYYGGHTCPICEYDLCADCSTIYCRLGHPLKIWTLPEAKSLYCELCKNSPIISGYRCLTCNIDICDMCTTRDSRNAFMLWPRREFHRIMDYLESTKEQSLVAKLYLQHFYHSSSGVEKGGGSGSGGGGDSAMVIKEYLTSMSKLCRKLQEVTEVKKQVDEELANAFPERIEN
jgi:hypothetical protein